MGPRLGRVEYDLVCNDLASVVLASMGPRLGRVEYAGIVPRPIRESWLQWGHA